MMDVDQVRELSGYGLFITAVSVTTFSFLYGFRSSWRSTTLGWTFLAMMSSFALFVDTNLVFRILRNENEAFVFYLLGVETFLVSVSTTMLTIHLYLIQHRARKGSREYGRKEERLHD